MRSRVLRRTVLVLALLGVPAFWWGWARADEAALRSAGFDEARDEFPQRYFAARAAEGLPPAEVARRMPPGAVVTRYIAPLAGGPDSVLLERYVYRAALIGRWPVQIYYRQFGGVNAVYAQDQWPSLRGARPVSAAEAERWRAGPVSPARLRRPAP